MYRIRFHGRGGQGMKTASRILGTAFFLEGFEVQDAPRYGAERRGAPIFAYVRAGRDVIHERGVIDRPDLVIVADDSLIGVPAAGILAGIATQTVLLIYTHEPADVWKHRLNLACTVLVLPAHDDVTDRAALSYTGAACAGAAARLVGVISRQRLLEAVARELEALPAATVDANRRRAGEAFDLLARHEGVVCASEDTSAANYEKPAWMDLPFEAADLSAPAIYNTLTSVEVKTGLWRTMRPLIDLDHCHRCWWVCSTLCPDGAIDVKDDGTPDIDYDHCKGCLVCVAVCPHHAIEALPEHRALRAPATEAGP
jgi:pyruvate ferredoxin oxidoreductase gamma subunit